MSQQNSSSTKVIHTASLVKRILIAAAIALVLITIFLLPVEGRPEWGNFWKVRPMIIVPLAGAAGGACSYLLKHLLGDGGRRKILIAILSIVVYVIGLWMGTILGLDGTLWD
ncbi:potassium transporter KefB [Chitinophaga barathri]|nr:potassium transporter KefB [Chitinophaga barathri]